MIVVLYLTLMISGAIGCAIKPQKDYISGLEPVKSAFITYSIFGLFVLSDIIYKNIRIFFVLLLLLTSLFGIYYTLRSGSIAKDRIKDVALYISLIYIICKNFELPFHVFCKPEIEVITGIIAFVIVVYSIFVSHNFIRLSIYPIVEKIEIIQIQFMVIALTGLFCITYSVIPLIVALAISIYALKLIFDVIKNSFGNITHFRLSKRIK